MEYAYLRSQSYSAFFSFFSAGGDAESGVLGISVGAI